MTSDISLDGDRVVLEGNAVDVKAARLDLSFASHRRNDNPSRRALVHSEADQLVMNMEGDFPGGVRIHGDVYVDVPPFTEGPPSSSAVEDAEVAASEVSDSLGFILGSSVVDPVRPGNHLVRDPSLGDVNPFPFSVDLSVLFDVESPITLGAEIQRLRRAVLQLNRRLERLEGRER